MNGKFRLGRAAFAAAIGLSLVLGSAVSAAAAPTGSTLRPATGQKSLSSVHPTRTAAACPQPGQRVKSTASPNVYVIDPDYLLNHIPSEAVYFNLWDSWAGISTVSESTLVECFGVYYTMNNAHLAKTSSSPAVYIYDSGGGGYRWITSEAVFNKYGFSWGKIKTLSSISPISSWNWDY